MYYFQFQLTLEYIFNITNGYWTLYAVEINGNNTLFVTGAFPSAPLGFSYKCSKSLIFESGGVTLELPNIQVNFIRNIINMHFDSENKILY